MATTKKRRGKDAEKALSDFLNDYINSGQLDSDLGSLTASQRIQAVTKLLPYCIVKQKEPKNDADSLRTGVDSLALFFKRLG